MKRMIIAGLILLISTTLTATAADEILFSEDWESGRINPSKWSLGGIPTPRIRAGGLDSLFALESNGDQICDSAAYTGIWFFTAKGISAEFWLKLPDCLLCSTTTSRTGFTTRNLINSGGCTPDENYYEGLAYVELNGSAGRINYVVEPVGTIFSESYRDSQWHQYKVQINSTGIVEFYRDGQLKASSNVPLDIDRNLGARFQHWGQRNISPHLIDDITISQPEDAGNLLFDSEVDNYTVVSVDPPVQLPPQPLKGIVRVTVKLDPFVDFGSESALVVTFTSLDEVFGLGGGSIQVAVPESVSPVYDSFQTEWTYYNPDCNGPVTLGIPQTDCDNSDNIADLLLNLYPPNGNAVISSLGLGSSVQCAAGSNNPYEGTLFEAHNTHDTVNYLWFDPADVSCAVGEAFDGKEIAISIPIEESATDALSALDASKMTLNARFQVITKANGRVYDVDILVDKIDP